MTTKRNFIIFQTLCQKAKKTKNPLDIKEALRFGLDNNISASKIRKYLS